MIKCEICTNYQRNGTKHSCVKCDTVTVYGALQEQFIYCCPYFNMTQKEKKRRAYLKKINSLPIDNDRRGGARK